MNYFFHPQAEAEHLDTIAYYEERQPGLGASYLSEFESAMVQACNHPKRFPIDRRPDIRRIGLKRFPFTLHFREFSGGQVQVLAVAHHRRRPQYWLNRL